LTRQPYCQNRRLHGLNLFPADRRPAPGAAAAIRELREETGYTGGRWQIIGRVRPNPAIQNNWLYTALAEGVAQTDAPDPGAGEVLDVATATLEEIRQKLVAGEIDHALVVAGFAHLAFRGERLHAPDDRATIT